VNANKILATVESPYLKSGLPDFRPGDTLRVHVKVVEGESERIQMYEGLVIARKGGGLSETFTVRKISFGIGVERCFPLNSPTIEKIDITRSGHVRRAKLYYLRDRVGRAARLEEKENTGSAAAEAKKTLDKKAAPAAAPAPALAAEK
jgi:large subunit ribosomal protein L19